MIPTTKKKNQQNVPKGGRDVWDVWDVYVKRTISKIQRDKNQIIFPRDGFECDGGDVGVVEICRVVHYDVLMIEFCVKKRKQKKQKKKEIQAGLVGWEG